MREYIGWLADRADKLPACLSERFSELRSSFEGSDYGRISEAAAFMALSFELLVDFLLEVGAFSEAEAAAHKANCFKELKGLAAAQQNFMEQAEPCKVFLETLGSLIAAGSVVIRNCTDMRDLEESNKPFIGYEDSEYYYLLPQATYTAVYKACSDEGSFFPIPKKDLGKELADKGIILTEGKRYDKRKLIRCIGKQERFWWIEKKVANE